MAQPDSHVHDMLLSVGLAFAAGIPLVTIARRVGLPPILLLTAAGVLIGPGVLGEAALVDPADLGRGLEVLVILLDIRTCTWMFL